MSQSSESIHSRALQYFVKENPSDANDKQFICNIITEGKSCNKKINEKKRSNLTVHIQNVHKDFCDQNLSKDRFDAREMTVSRLKYIQDRAEIVAVNLRPFELLNDSGFFENDKLFVVLLQKWNVLCDLVTVLKIPFDMTCYLQSPKLTLSDMYGRWLKLSEVELKRLIRTNVGSQPKLSEMLYKSLENRKPMYSPVCIWIHDTDIFYLTTS